ncbi:hypothetical protein ACLB2K_018857 [Fragaria x ananassa]
MFYLFTPYLVSSSSCTDAGLYLIHSKSANHRDLAAAMDEWIIMIQILHCYPFPNPISQTRDWNGTHNLYDWHHFVSKCQHQWIRRRRRQSPEITVTFAYGDSLFMRRSSKLTTESIICSQDSTSSLRRLHHLCQDTIATSPHICTMHCWIHIMHTSLYWRFAALYVSQHIFALDGEIDEIVGHTYLFLKEQLELSSMPPPSGILHGTMIDQFIACGKSRDMAHELASQIWLAVLDNLEETEHTFQILKRLAQEGDHFGQVFLPYPYSRSIKVQWKVFEKLFTDFRDCLNYVDYYDVLACAKNKFQPIPSIWLGH